MRNESCAVVSGLIIAVALALPARGNHVDRNEIREWDPTYPRRSEVERARERADDATAGHALQMLKAQGTCKWTNSARWASNYFELWLAAELDSST